jgi:hypothetical protein
MMNKQTQEALKMAIEAFERWEDTYKADCTEVINACKEALEQSDRPTNAVLVPADKLKDMQRRLKALEQPITRDWKETIDERIARDSEFKEALEQPAQEPLTRAQQVILANNKALEPVACLENGNVNWAKYPNDQSKPIPLYTHPHQWQGLTDDEIDKIYFKEFDMWSSQVDIDFAHAIEQALKEKNHA